MKNTTYGTRGVTRVRGEEARAAVVRGGKINILVEKNGIFCSLIIFKLF